jgi:hypothetical protein
MSHRLQVLISPELDQQLEKAAQRSRISKGEWVRRALQDSLRQPSRKGAAYDPVARLSGLSAPSGDIAKMLSEIERGRS